MRVLFLISSSPSSMVGLLLWATIGVLTMTINTEKSGVTALSSFSTSSNHNLKSAEMMTTSTSTSTSTSTTTTGTTAKNGNLKLLNRRNWNEKMLRFGFLTAAGIGTGTGTGFGTSASVFFPVASCHAEDGTNFIMNSNNNVNVNNNSDEIHGKDSSNIRNHNSDNKQMMKTIAYKSISFPIRGYNTDIPVSMWYPVNTENNNNDGVFISSSSPSSLSSSRTGTSTTFSSPRQTTTKKDDKEDGMVTYEHNISVKRIGQLLAGWEFIPTFVSKRFSFMPTILKTSTSSPSSTTTTTTSTVDDDTEPTINFIDGKNIPIPKKSKVVFLAHGYLGSRFDLSHIAEELAKEGYVCISPEYPESLAASYQRIDGLERSIINEQLIKFVSTNLQPTSYAGIGHSLGCGSVLRMGDESWTRVLLAGRIPENYQSKLLFISSTNDCTVKFGGPLAIPSEFVSFQEGAIPNELPDRSALIFDRPDGPNHISYLSEDVNEAMVSFLSPLLPVAQAMSIPVLDFDKYQQSRDSVQTAKIIKPIISNFLSQKM